MMEAGEHIDALIAKYLSAEANANERTELFAWTKLSEENLQYFEDSKRLFAAIETNSLQWKVDVTSAWQKVDARTQTPAKIISLWSRQTVTGIAAAILIVGLAMFFYLRNTAEEPVLLSLQAAPTIQQSALPDGSKVTLNAGSELKYSLRKGRRHVELKGEAYFEVVHNAEQSFEVQSGDVIIRDIGTAFNVKPLQAGNLEVSVLEGEVELLSENGGSLFLKAGEKGLYKTSSKSFEKLGGAVSTSDAAYATKDFEFEAEKLQEVIRQINSAYNVDIKIEDARMKNCLFSVSFHNEDLEMVLDVIAETLSMQVEKQGSKIILKGGSCQ